MGATTVPEPSAAASQSSPASSSPTTPSLASSLDALGRSTATIVVVIYAFGFVILGFHDARYGVAQFSPFRARIILVGFVFVMLVGAAAAAQRYSLMYLPWVEQIIKDAEPKRRTHRQIILTAAFVYTAGAMSTGLGNFLFRDFFLQHPPVVKHPVWQSIPSSILYAAGLIMFYPVSKIYVRKPRHATLLAVLGLMMVAMGTLLPSRNMTPYGYLTLILFLIGWQTIWIKNLKNPIAYVLDYRIWPLALVIVWLYIAYVFSAVPPRWGGGQPIPVQILQNTPAPWLGSNPADVLLLDETDQGLYVLLSPTGKAYFVPRANVASMFFGTKDELKKPSP